MISVYLLQALPDDYRQSMVGYGAHLFHHLQQLKNNAYGFAPFLPARNASPSKISRYWQQYVKYPLAASSLKADIFHILDHSFSHLLHSLPAEKTVITLHDLSLFDRQKGFFQKTVSNPINRSAILKAGKIICVSHATYQQAIEKLGCKPEQLHIVSEGVDPIFLKTLPDNLEKQDLSQITIFHPGHTGDYKNIPAIFYVVKVLKDKGFHVRLLKTGTPFTQKQLSLIRHLGISNDILHEGLVEKSKMPFFYQQASVLLFPSLNEGFGFPLLEAMACGVPVVASNRGSIPEVAGNAAVIFEPDNYEGMAQAIIRLHDDKVWRQDFIAKGKIRANQFSWEETARKTLEIYMSLQQRSL